jgi:hypothetical protein
LIKCIKNTRSLKKYNSTTSKIKTTQFDCEEKCWDKIGVLQSQALNAHYSTYHEIVETLRKLEESLNKDIKSSRTLTTWFLLWGSTIADVLYFNRRNTIQTTITYFKT